MRRAAVLDMAQSDTWECVLGNTEYKRRYVHWLILFDLHEATQ
jgi:hypothetical protein